MDLPLERRREFIRDVVRTGLACGLAATGALLIWRRRRNGECADAEACRRCGVSGSCPIRQDRNDGNHE